MEARVFWWFVSDIFGLAVCIVAVLWGLGRLTKKLAEEFFGG